MRHRLCELPPAALVALSLTRQVVHRSFRAQSIAHNSDDDSEHCTESFPSIPRLLPGKLQRVLFIPQALTAWFCSQAMIIDEVCESLFTEKALFDKCPISCRL